MNGRPAGERAAAALLEHQETLAREITVALYAGLPELLGRSWEGGREKCLQDMRYNLEHLAPAPRCRLAPDEVAAVSTCLRAGAAAPYVPAA